MLLFGAVIAPGGAFLELPHDGFVDVPNHELSHVPITSSASNASTGSASRRPPLARLHCRPKLGTEQDASSERPQRPLLTLQALNVGTTWEQLRPNTREEQGAGPTSKQDESTR